MERYGDGSALQKVSAFTPRFKNPKPIKKTNNPGPVPH